MVPRFPWSQLLLDPSILRLQESESLYYYCEGQNLGRTDRLVWLVYIAGSRSPRYYCFDGDCRICYCTCNPLMLDTWLTKMNELMTNQSKLHYPTNGKSTYLLAPYCVWLSYATYLNANIWWNNRNKHLPQVDWIMDVENTVENTGERQNN